MEAPSSGWDETTVAGADGLFSARLPFVLEADDDIEALLGVLLREAGAGERLTADRRPIEARVPEPSLRLRRPTRPARSMRKATSATGARPPRKGSLGGDQWAKTGLGAASDTRRAGSRRGEDRPGSAWSQGGGQHGGGRNGGFRRGASCWGVNAEHRGRRSAGSASSRDAAASRARDAPQGGSAAGRRRGPRGRASRVGITILGRRPRRAPACAPGARAGMGATRGGDALGVILRHALERGTAGSTTRDGRETARRGDVRHEPIGRTGSTIRIGCRVPRAGGRRG